MPWSRLIRGEGRVVREWSRARASVRGRRASAADDAVCGCAQSAAMQSSRCVLQVVASEGASEITLARY